jgi:branched-chain amino acid transport system substrate-binding protein
MKKFRRTIAVVSAAGLAVIAATSSATAARTPQASAGATACTAKSIGVSAPLTGPAAFLGQEQLSWIKFAASNFNKQNKTTFKVVQGDTQLSASLARTVGRQFVSNREIFGVVGPSISQGVISSGNLFEAVGLAAVSGSATRVDLTNGQFRTFFRVVPHDGIQAPNISDFILKTVRADRVVVIDSQDDYSLALADRIQPRLAGRGVTVDRESVAATDTDFSSLVSGVADDVDVVIFATQTAPAAHTLSQQLLEQGKRAVVFGTDGAYSPSQFKPRNGYVSVFAPDLRFAPAAASIVRQYNRFSKNKPFGSFGPASYQAAWVLLTAMEQACEDDRITRPEVTANVRKTNVPSILLGGNTRFTARGDVRSPKFFIYRITNGNYRAVG